MSPLDFTTQTGNFQVATRLLFGSGALAALPEELSHLEVRTPLLVTDAGLRRAGIAGRVERTLQAAGFDACLARPYCAAALIAAVEKATDLIT